VADWAEPELAELAATVALVAALEVTQPPQMEASHFRTFGDIPVAQTDQARVLAAAAAHQL